MPIDIVKKQKTVPTRASQHETMVPLRCVGIAHGAPDSLTKSMANYVGVGDVCVSVYDHQSYGTRVLNCSTGKLLEPKLAEYLDFVREYTVAQIVITNDSNPAPIV